MDARHSCCLFHFRATGVGPAIEDVVVNRIVEEHRILRHDTYRSAQAFLSDIADILSVDTHATRRDIVEAKEDAAQRRFAGATGTDNRHSLARRYSEGDTLQDRAPCVVVEIDIFKPHFRTVHGEWFSFRLVGDFNRHLQHVEHHLHVG